MTCRDASLLTWQAVADFAGCGTSVLRARLCAMCICAIALLAGCGGGAGTRPVEAFPVVQTVGATSPAARGYVFGLDRQDRLVYAARRTGPDLPALSAHSTALALVSMAIPAQGPRLPPEKVDNLIVGAPSFPRLAQAVEQSVRAQGTPLDSDAVYELVVAVGREIKPAYSAALAPTGPARRQFSKINGTPFTLVDGPALYNLNLTGVGSTGVIVQNDTEFAWDVVGADGQLRTVLPEEHVEVPDRGGVRFNLGVLHGPDTMRLNRWMLIEAASLQIFQAVFGEALGDDVLEDCAALIDGAARSEALTSLLLPNSMDRFMTQLAPTLFDEATGVAQCAAGLIADPDPKNSKKAANQVAKFIDTLVKVKSAVVDAGLFGVKVWAFVESIGFNESFVVCQDTHRQIVGCAERYELYFDRGFFTSGEPAALVPYAVAPVTLLAFTDTNSRTALPPGLQVLGENAHVTLSIKDLTVSAGAPGIANLRVLDPATGKESNEMRIEVVIPAMMPSAAQVNVGDQHIFRLVHPADPTKALVFTGAGLAWEIVGRNGGVATGQPLLNTFVTVAIAAGAVDIYARFGTAGPQEWHPKATMTIVGAAANIVVVTPGSTTLGIGASTTLGATLMAGDQPATPQPTFTWSSNNPAVASVSPAGVVSAAGTGTAVITARDPSTNLSGNASVTVGCGSTPLFNGITFNASQTNNVEVHLGFACITSSVSLEITETRRFNYYQPEIGPDGQVVGYTPLPQEETTTTTWSFTPASLTGPITNQDLLFGGFDATTGFPAGFIGVSFKITAILQDGSRVTRSGTY